jgi:hypothetical protein
MSLDFYLLENDTEVYSGNITHNLVGMAKAAGVYNVLWRPDEHGITHAIQCIEPLRKALLELVCNKTEYEMYNSPNGWGVYKDFLRFVIETLSACCQYPSTTVKVWR